MKKILVATDGSAGAHAALEWAAEFAAAVHAKVVVASVLEYGDDDNLEERGIRAVDALTNRWGRPFDDRGVDHEHLVLEGDPRGALVSAAADGDIDAIVIGTRGAGGFLGLGVGGVAHYVARHAPCPIIAVPRSGGPITGGTVVVGADASTANEPALRWAEEAAHRLGSTAVALFAHSPLADVMTHKESNWQYPGEQALRAHVASVSAGVGDIEIVLAAGNPVEELVRLGDERDASLIVVGRRGRGGLAGLVLGRVPAQLLHHAGRPVAVIPH